jgi:hypothetical protein
MICSGEGESGRSHIDMWIPSLLKADVSVAVLTRNVRLFDYLTTRYPDLSVVLATSPEHVENVIQMTPTLKAILYTSNTGNNLHLLRFNQLSHVFIGHGDSDKSGSAHKFFRAYDEVWAAGQAHIDRFENAPFSTNHMVFRRIGRPNLLTLLDSDLSLPPACLETATAPKILYLPTWEGVFAEQSYTSLYSSVELLTTAARALNAAVTIKLHPQTGSKNRALRKADADLVKALGEANLTVDMIDRGVRLDEVLPLAGVVICDISAVLSECLVVDVPIFVYRPDQTNIKLAKSKMDPEYFAYLFSDTAGLRLQLQDFLQNGDRFARQRAEAREYLLGASDTARGAFRQELQRICANTSYSGGGA